MGQQTGQCGGVDAVRRRGCLVAVQAEFAADLLELGVQILPLPDPQEVQELVPAHPPERVAGQGFLLLAQVVPQPQQGEEIAAVALPFDGSGPERTRAEPVEALGSLPFRHVP